jgi:catechol 2,3-dioxygenase-like lactoylglutathione lyase family enzyme
MRITLSSIIVEDQPRALAFYRDVLGFAVKDDIDVGQGPSAHWITLASPEDPDGARISLEPAFFQWAKDYQQALKSNGVPLTAFEVKSVQQEYERLTKSGVVFKSPPKAGDAAMPSMATFDDTAGNWIMIYEAPKPA